MTKIITKIVILLGLTFLSAGCVSMQTGNSGNSKVASMSSDEAYSIGTTTLESVQNELGGTMYVFKKANGNTKYVWQSESGSVSAIGLPFVGGISNKTDRHTLALTFDKNNILSKKSFHKDDYTDPDVTQMQSQMMNKYMNP